MLLTVILLIIVGLLILLWWYIVGLAIGIILFAFTGYKLTLLEQMILGAVISLLFGISVRTNE